MSFIFSLKTAIFLVLNLLVWWICNILQNERSSLQSDQVSIANWILRVGTTQKRSSDSNNGIPIKFHIWFVRVVFKSEATLRTRIVVKYSHKLQLRNNHSQQEIDKFVYSNVHYKCKFGGAQQNTTNQRNTNTFKSVCPAEFKVQFKTINAVQMLKITVF